MEDRMQGYCENCRFWEETRRSGMTYCERGGECRRYPPTQQEHGIGAWFITNAYHWCGEFQAKVPEEDSGYSY